jgi:ketosteroid isomerase-like protein
MTAGTPIANKQLVLDYLEAIAEGRTDDAKSAFATDVLWKHPPSLGNGGRLEGRDAVFDRYFAVDDDLFETGRSQYDFEILSAIAEGDRVAVEMRHRGNAKNGQPFESDYHVSFQVRGGLIREVHEYLDSLWVKRELLGGDH